MLRGCAEEILAKNNLDATGTVAAGSYPVSLFIEGSEKFAYAANQNSNNVSMYTIDANSGMLTPLGTIAAGAQTISFKRRTRFTRERNSRFA